MGDPSAQKWMFSSTIVPSASAGFHSRHVDAGAQETATPEPWYDARDGSPIAPAMSSAYLTAQRAFMQVWGQDLFFAPPEEEQQQQQEKPEEQNEVAAMAGSWILSTAEAAATQAAGFWADSAVAPSHAIRGGPSGDSCEHEKVNATHAMDRGEGLEGNQSSGVRALPYSHAARLYQQQQSYAAEMQTGDQSSCMPAWFHPRYSQSEEQVEIAAPVRPTTLMLRNIPARCSVEEVLQVIQDSGFQGAFEFLYVPMKPNTSMNKGYGFAAFMNVDHAMRFFHAIDGQTFHSRVSSKEIRVEPARSHIAVAEMPTSVVKMSKWGPVLAMQ